MTDIELLDSCAQKKTKAQQLLETILLQANYFEQAMRVAPVIFMSHDLFAIVVSGLSDHLLYRVEKNRPVRTICGYDLELIEHGSELLYVGYRILF